MTHGGEGRTPRRSRTASVVAFGVAILFLAPAALVVGSVGHPAAPGTPLSARPHPAFERQASVRGAGGHLVINGTLSLTNGTVFPGNVSVNPLYDPTWLAYSNASGSVLTAGPGDSNVSLLNTSTYLARDTISLGLNATAFGYDPVLGELFAGVSYCVVSFFGFCLTSSSSILVAGVANQTVFANLSADGNLPVSFVYDPVAGAMVVGLDNGTVEAINASTDTLAWTATGFPSPSASCFDTAADAVFVADNVSGILSKLNASTGALSGQVALGPQPSSVACDPANGTVYVGDNLTENVSIVGDVAVNLQGNFTTGFVPRALAYDRPDAGVFVVGRNNTTGLVAFVPAGRTGATEVVRVGYGFGGDPLSSATLDPIHDQLYVADPLYSTVFVLNASPLAVVHLVPFASYPYGLVDDPGRAQMFVSDYYSGGIYAVSETTNQVVGIAPDGDASGGMAYDPAAGAIVVANPFYGNLSVVSDRNDRVVANVSLPTCAGPIGPVYDANHHAIWVACESNNSVVEVNDTTWATSATISVGNVPFALALDPVHEQVYVLNLNSSRLDVVSAATDRVLGAIPLGDSNTVASALVYDPGAHEIFVLDSGHSRLDVVSPALHRVVDHIPLRGGVTATSIAYDPARSAILIPATGINQIWPYGVLVVSDRTDRLVQAVPAPSSLTSIAYAQATQTDYLTNPFDGSVSLLAGATLTFQERGVPAGYSWNVTLLSPSLGYPTAGNVTSNHSGSVAFSVPGGTYSFYIQPPSLGFFSSFGVFSVSGRGLLNNTTVAFSGSTTVLVTFRELTTIAFFKAYPSARWPGLPGGLPWSVSIAPLDAPQLAGQNATTTGSNVTFSVFVNVTYHFRISVPGGYHVGRPTGLLRAHWWELDVQVRFAPDPVRLALTLPFVPSSVASAPGTLRLRSVAGAT